MNPDSHSQHVDTGQGIAALNLPELYQCVHCGLCLNQCPTYRATRLEAESPRGRIHLVKAAADGRIELSERFKEHLYLCLLCRACESACPSGVEYGRIAAAAREQLGPPGTDFSRAVLNFAFTQLLPNRRRLRLLFGILRLYQRTGLRRAVHCLLPKKLSALDTLLPEIPRRFCGLKRAPLPPLVARRAKVAMLDGCVMPLLFGEVNDATVRVFRRNGCEVVFPKGQTCCGALNFHNGETAAAKRMARRNIDAFLTSDADAIIVNSAGCGAMMKEYRYLLREDSEYRDKAEQLSARVQDAAEFLANLGLVGELGPIKMTVTYQDPCHLAHGQRVRSQPRRLLQAIPSLQLIEMDGADRCCGSAGIYSLTHPAMSQRLLEEKLQAIGATHADAVVAPNPGCILQLRSGARRAGTPLQVYHLMDLLERAYRAAE